MKCAACHNAMLKRRAELDLRIAGCLYLVRNVRFEECPVCGERVLSPEVSQMLFEKIRKEEFVKETICVPVLDGTYG
jgi:YgiT-type zinc finger domain-containing protein